MKREREKLMNERILGGGVYITLHSDLEAFVPSVIQNVVYID
jgi:hypothetical protein